MDAAAFGWGRLFNNSGKGVEYSGLIYKINFKGTDYFGFTRGVRFPDKKNQKDHDPKISSPGPDDAAHNPTLPKGAEMVGYIHTHLTSSGNRDFSASNAVDGNDEKLIADHSDLTFYLINDIGDLRVSRPGENYGRKWFSGKIGEDFYGGNGYVEKVNGRVFRYGDVPSPYWGGEEKERSFLDGRIKTIMDTYPVRYIDFCGSVYGLDGKRLK